MKNIEPIPVESPLKGEWMVLNSPGTKVPSHGTDFLAQTYAFDLLQVDWSHKPVKFYKKSVLDYFLGKVHLSDCYCYGKPIYAPISGTVVEALDGYPERDPVQPFRDISVAFKNAWFFDPQKHSIQDVAGNFIIIQGEEACAVLVHMKKGSIKVKKGDEINSGDLVGNIGHSGNSTAPHLHFHLMDSPDPITAKGIPCCFREYELYFNGRWIKVKPSNTSVSNTENSLNFRADGVPKNKDRIRF